MTSLLVEPICEEEEVERGLVVQAEETIAIKLPHTTHTPFYVVEQIDPEFAVILEDADV